MWLDKVGRSSIKEYEKQNKFWYKKNKSKKIKSSKSEEAISG